MNPAYPYTFFEAYTLTMKNEGGSSTLTDIPADPGKMTFGGISRRWHPDWAGWAIIDNGGHNTDAGMRTLHDLHKGFYYEVFWLQIKGGSLADLNRSVCFKVFDMAVHRSVKTSSLYLQRTLNLLNFGSSLYPNLKLDGKIGVITIHALATALDRHDKTTIIDWLCVMHGADMVHFAEAQPSHETFVGLASRSIWRF